MPQKTYMKTNYELMENHFTPQIQSDLGSDHLVLSIMFKN